MSRIIEVKIFPVEKSKLFDYLEKNRIMVNESCRRYILHENFKFSEREFTKQIIITTLEEMGFTKPCTLMEIFRKAKSIGYDLCDYNLGVYLRLAFLNQVNSKNSILSGQHKSPNSSIQVVSNPVEEDDEFPKGLYLRKVDNQLWLRGFRCDFLHEFEISNEMAFELKE